MSQKDSRYDIHDLSDKFLKGTLSEAERAWFEEWYSSFDDSLLEVYESRYPNRKTLRKAIKKRIQLATAYSPKQPVLRRLMGWVAAAAVFIIVGFSVFLFTTSEPAVQKTAAIVPGRDQAVLTLANGKTIVLDAAAEGRLAEEQGVGITKTDSSMISYDFPAVNTKGAPAAYNTIRTPRGGQFRLGLADGTKIWLNSDSYVRFPVSFGTKERSIEAGGEIYLEVAKDASRRFLVKTEGQTIQVLGTRFNINAYPDEPETRTTLFEGSVKLSAGRSDLVLKPGQQSVLHANRELEIDPNADIEVAGAWKNGYFMFDREDIRTAMRKIGRWYDVDVIYQGVVPDDWLGGSISRYKRVEDVLAKLELTGQFRFKIEGRRVIVMH
ncbi:hypothetical protein C7T94_06280 [Pedobacter yulinensis]|uniref:Anti-sigma factor n=1 Tax=Pedobacter yulinensis TaxID=2126353 RepID=A0A2T3HPD1_9SPHI|nr:FecR domain-containing protein [Pedobacter yulinensis]PST84320.1 hypothetical protein C7T94_06280 [Pedobacter yulinensis]